jgi:hypothetical protein
MEDLSNVLERSKEILFEAHDKVQIMKDKLISLSEYLSLLNGDIDKKMVIIIGESNILLNSITKKLLDSIYLFNDSNIKDAIIISYSIVKINEYI